MNKIMTFLVVTLFSFSALAEPHNSVDAELSDAIKAFSVAYTNNNMTAYLSAIAAPCSWRRRTLIRRVLNA